MLHIEDQDDAAWVNLTRLLASREPLEMVLCLYPDQSADELPEPFEPASASLRIERVTHYDDGDPPCSAPARVDEDLLEALEEGVGEFEDWGDNLAVYRPPARDWLACLIPHERMILVSDDALLPFLRHEGLRADAEPPEWWERT